MRLIVAFTFRDDLLSDRSETAFLRYIPLRCGNIYRLVNYALIGKSHLS
jgi:hypothetical protein